MKIKRSTKRYTRDISMSAVKNSIEEISGIPCDFCCEVMAGAWEEDFISFGEFEGLLNKNGNVNIYHCRPYPEGAFWDELAIKFCPFCGEKIEIIDEDDA